MARAREDARQGVPAHVKVYLETRTHRKTGPYFASPEFRGQFLGLLLLARDREPGPDGTTIYLGKREVAWVTGKNRADWARVALVELCWVLEFPMRLNGIPVVGVWELEEPDDEYPLGSCEPGEGWDRAEIRQLSGGGRVLVQARAPDGASVVRAAVVGETPQNNGDTDRTSGDLTRSDRRRIGTRSNQDRSKIASILLPNYPERQRLRFRYADTGREKPITIGTTRDGGSGDPGEVPAPKDQDSQPARATPLAKRRTQVHKLWPRLVAKAATYGKVWGDHLGEARLRMIAARLNAGATEAELLEVIDGYMAMHGSEQQGDFAPMKFLRPETLYQASKFEGYLDAARSTPGERESATDRYLREQAKRTSKEDDDDDPDST